MIETKYIVAGSGLSGAVAAERIASVLGEAVTVVERRNAVGGNCRSTVDPETGIECHCYGSHIFHTASEKAWRYIKRFSPFTSYRHRVLARSGDKIYFLPINLKTIDDVYLRVLSPAEARQAIAADGGYGVHADNLEAKAISLIGKKLYRKLIRRYTRKQWNKPPRELSADIIARLPVRMNFNTDYFDDPYQGLPYAGYGRLFEKMLADPKIHVVLNADFKTVRSEIRPDALIVYTGMIDEYFDYVFGPLEWRSLRFEWESPKVRDYQGTAVINYVDKSVPYMRIHEFKHLHPEREAPYRFPETVICREYSEDWRRGREAYYPVNTLRNQRLLERYQKLAQAEKNVIFAGRLGCYRYWNMDTAILNALDCFESRIKHRKAV